MQIAITGIGIISALGKGQAANRRGLMDGHTAVRPARLLSTCHHEWPIGEVPMSNADMTKSLGVTQTLSRSILLGLTALDECIRDAGLKGTDISGVPLVNGTTVGGMDLTEQYYAEWRKGNYEQVDIVRQHEAAQTTRALSEYFHLKGGTTISTACSSALNAIIRAVGTIQSGECRCVIAGGTEAMTRFHLNGFASLGILSKEVCRPFCDDRDGINLGEGAAYLVLEDAQEAMRRGAKIYGYIAGYANRCDTYHATSSSPNGEGAYAAMRGAIGMAKLMPKQICYVNAHGTATPNNDASEMCAIHRIWGESLPCVESTKSLTGHTTSASGSVEVIYSLMQIHENGYEFALSNAFAFGGNNSSVVLSRLPVDLPKLSPRIIKVGSLHTSEGEKEYKSYISPMDARRLTAMMRQLIVVAREAMDEAGVTMVDGIVVATRWGGMLPTVQLLDILTELGEQDLSPAQFMNSTHNAAAGTLARMIGCKGYNSTVVSDTDGMEAARNEAVIAAESMGMKTMLVCSLDETEASWRGILQQVGIESKNEAKAQIIWLD